MPTKQKPKRKVFGRRVEHLLLNNGKRLPLVYYIRGCPLEDAIVKYTTGIAKRAGFTHETLTYKDLMREGSKFISQSEILTKTWSFHSVEDLCENYVKPRLRWLLLSEKSE